MVRPSKAHPRPRFATLLLLTCHLRPPTAGMYGYVGDGWHGLYHPSSGWMYLSGRAGAPSFLPNQHAIFCTSADSAKSEYRFNGRQLFNGCSPPKQAPEGMAINAAGVYWMEPSNLFIGDMIFWNRALKSTEMELVEGYLSWTYNITDRLPASHPFKNSRPLVPDPATLVRPTPSATMSPGLTTFIGVAAQGSAIVRTAAGSGVAGARRWEDGSPAVFAAVKPWKLAHDAPRSRLIFSDRDNHVIRAIDLVNGLITTLAGTPAVSGYVDSAMPLETRFNSPRGVAMAPDGTILVTDTANNAIRAIWPNGTTTTIAGSSGAGFRDGLARTALLNQPQDIAYDGSDASTPFNFVILDTANNRVRRLFLNASDFWLVTIAGTGSTTWTGGGMALSTALDTPTSLAVSRAGIVFVSLSSASRIVQLSFGGAGGIGVATVLVGSGTAASTGDGADGLCASTRTSHGMAVSPDNSLIWSEYDAHGVRILLSTTTSEATLSGWNNTIVRLAGTYRNTPFNDDVPASETNLNNPAGIAVDGRGGMWIADYS